MSFKLRIGTLLVSAALIGGCWSDSDTISTESSSTTDTTTDTTTFAGTLLVPESTEIRSARALSRNLNISSYSAECTNVPTGYLPMSSATVAIEDSVSGQVGDTTTTDSCGSFVIEVPVDSADTEGYVIAATADGYKALKANAANFQQSGTTPNTSVVASTIPSNATYVISAMQKAGGSEFIFSITDSVTNNAVIQLSKDAFRLEINDFPVNFLSLNTSEQLAVSTSNVLALDASGSMFANEFDESVDPPVAIIDGNGNPVTLLQLTASAAHQFISEKADADEVAVVPFDSNVELIDNTLLANYSMTDSDSANVTYNYSDSGFVTSKADLHFSVDMYNAFSPLWNNFYRYDEKHADRTDSVSSLNDDYRWSGGTQLEGAINDSVTLASARSNTLKRIFVMTDGNSSFADRDGVVAAALQNSIPVNAISVGSGANTVDLSVIAQETGGAFFELTDAINIAGIYSSLQTSVKFSYVAYLGIPLQAGDVIKLTLDLNGETVIRTITL
ncbi:von Willebrand factor type A domain-containing protein [Vibrio crassostreae]|uniref:vWA domain-containing protein n=1 Tax=Vibrio crassostreae TaxID=246167 RepID=UPI000F49F2E0|nr:vWA domain-containing protein [Vibrio crassostreae]NOH74777.1 VWA domain-containing protein [Vibrio crassostreae]ROR16186.1 von Willebrand factor type A domain-containing protein [Vibrio crassostreae]TCN74985.1 von Willebrand factor type A domain-containing protein [Vibrio crassostreae]TWD64999.1 von Willebrand factor type A domain-containing protein [Vibrio crassostreae]CAK2097696.1 von Willebrand factor type A domain-containing protein [Vibrio crassostreae]